METLNGAYASDRIVVGLLKSEAGFEQRASLGVVFRVGRRSGSMPEAPARQPADTITVLSLSTAGNDHAVLARTLRDSGLTLYPNCRLTLQPRTTLASALASLRGQPIPIVLCDADGQPEAWREILQVSKDLAKPPCVIVTSRLADDRLWAEVLNAGAFDLLSKPFNKSDVMRIIQSAWMHWRNRFGLAEKAGEFQEPAAGA